jgi:hypothetical protein
VTCERCEPSVIGVSFELTPAQLAAIGDEPGTWPTLGTDLGSCPVEIVAVHLELQGFDAAADALVLYADTQRQVNFAGRARPVWSYFPGAAPSWLVPGPTIAGGYRAECRLPLVMVARNLRLWTNAPLALTISGRVFYR